MTGRFRPSESLLVPAALAGLMTAATQVLLGGPVSPLLIGALSAGAMGLYALGRHVLPGPEDVFAHPNRVRPGAAMDSRRRARDGRAEAGTLPAPVVGLGAAAVGVPLAFVALLAAAGDVRVGLCVGLLGVCGAGYLALDHKGGWPWAVRPIVIAAVWTLATVGVPAIAHVPAVLPAGLLWLAIARFSLFLGNVLLTDVIDASGDALGGRRTPATVLGPRAAARRGRQLLAASGMVYLVAAAHTGNVLLAAEGFGCGLAALYVLHPAAHAAGSTGRIDAALLLPPALAVVASVGL